MWKVLVGTPLGRSSQRKFIVSLTALLVALFGYSLIHSTPVFAASDATWKDNSIIYNNHTYEGPKEATTTDTIKLEADTIYYQWQDDAGQKAYLIYFAPGANPPNEQQAGLAEYQIVDGSLTGPLSRTTILITPQAAVNPDGDSLKEGELNSCQIDGVGWLVCPLTRHIAKAMDYIYGVISEFLEVKPLETAQQGALYTAWDMARNIANILFVIGFLILIYGQISGGLASNYMAKKILPRIVVAAILVNISYWICAIGVDISNILGYAVQDLFITARNTLTQTAMEPVSWENATEFILTGGTAALGVGVMGAAAFAATGGSIVAAIYLLIPALVGVVLAALVALIVLAMRQALIVILIIIAPLAFVAYLLPNTEKWFDRWRQTFMTMLLLFPIFSLIFGGSQLAGTAIIQTAGSPAIAILGMVVMVAPLVITPMVVKFSGSLLGRIAGMINNPNKGLIDRTRNMTKPHAELHRDKNLARQNTGIHRYGAGRVARRMKRNELNREKRHEGYKKGLENRAHEWEASRLNRGPQRLQDAVNNRQQQKEYGHWDEQMRRADHKHHEIEAHHQAKWDQRFQKGSSQFDAALFAQEATTRKYAKSSEVAKGDLDATIREMEAGENTVTATEIALNVKDSKSREKVAADLGSLTTKLQDLNRQAVAEAERKASADVEIQGQIAQAFKANEIEIDGVKIRDYAGGIGGDKGATRVFAKAQSDIVTEMLTNIKNARSLLSEYSAGELIKLSQQGIDRDGKAYTDTGDALRLAAQQEILLTKGNNWAFQKEKDYVAQMGMQYDEESTVYDAAGNQVRYFTVKHDAAGNALKNSDGSYQREAIVTADNLIDNDEIGRRRDIQQMFVDGVKNSKLKIASISGTDRSNMETGLFVDSGKQAIIRDAKEGKMKADRWASMDYDEMMRTVQLMRENGAGSMRAELGDEQLDAMHASINTALNDPRLNVHLENRQVDILKMIQNYTGAHTRNITDPERINYETIDGRASKVPRDYDWRKSYGYEDPKGPA